MCHDRAAEATARAETPLSELLSIPTWPFMSCGTLLDAPGASLFSLPMGVGSGAHPGASPVSVSSFTPKSGLRITLRPPPPSPPSCHSLSLPLGAAVSPQAALAPADRHTDRLRVTCAPSRVFIPALHSPPCFSNANVAFDVHVFILEQERDAALDTVPTAALQQELPSCSLTPSQRFVIFEEITNLKVFGFGAAIAA